MPKNLIMFPVHLMTLSYNCYAIIKVSVYKFCWWLTSHSPSCLPTSQLETHQTPMLFIMNFFYTSHSVTRYLRGERSLNEFE
jgi:hypothetical protein